MLITVEMDPCGCLLLSPCNERIAKKLAKHMKEMTGHADSSAFIQEDYNVDAFLEELPAALARDVRAGWKVKIRFDPWTFAHYLGWDAHTVFEGGSRSSSV